LDITDTPTALCEFLQFRKKLNDVLLSCPRTKRQVTDKQKRLLKKIGKVAAYTAITGGSYILARGALSLLLKRWSRKIPQSRKRRTRKRNPPENPGAARSARNVSKTLYVALIAYVQGCSPRPQVCHYKNHIKLNFDAMVAG